MKILNSGKKKPSYEKTDLMENVILVIAIEYPIARHGVTYNEEIVFSATG
jgi:hypothetical protein